MNDRKQMIKSLIHGRHEWTNEGARTIVDFLIEMHDLNGEELEWNACEVNGLYREFGSALHAAESLGIIDLLDKDCQTEDGAIGLLDIEFNCLEFKLRNGGVIIDMQGWSEACTKSEEQIDAGIDSEADRSSSHIDCSEGGAA